MTVTIICFCADENLLLEALPKKMKADLAIHVHFNTLSKVHLFQVSMMLGLFSQQNSYDVFLYICR